MAANERVLVRMRIGSRTRSLNHPRLCCPRRRAGSGAGPMECRPQALQAGRRRGRVKGPQAGHSPALDPTAAPRERAASRTVLPLAHFPLKTSAGGATVKRWGAAGPRRGATARAPQPPTGARSGGWGEVQPPRAVVTSYSLRSYRTARACYGAPGGLIPLGQRHGNGSQDDESRAARVTC